MVSLRSKSAIGENVDSKKPPSRKGEGGLDFKFTFKFKQGEIYKDLIINTKSLNMKKHY